MGSRAVVAFTQAEANDVLMALATAAIFRKMPESVGRASLKIAEAMEYAERRDRDKKAEADAQ